MNFLSIAFLILEILILGLAAFIGYRRGTGRATVRFVYLAVIGVASFFIGRAIAFNLSGNIIKMVMGVLPADVQGILATAPEIELLIGSIAGALIAPVLFALLFGILQLLTLIYFKTISGKLVSLFYKKEEAPKYSKWVGTAIGLVSGVVIAAVLLSPLFSVMYIVENVPDETIAVFSDMLGFDEEDANADVAPTGAMKASITFLRPAIKLDTDFDVTHLTPWKTALVRALTTYEVPSKETDKPRQQEAATDSLPALIEAAGDAVYAYNTTTQHGGTSIDAATNAAAAIIPYLEKSATIKEVTSDALSAVGQTLQNEGAVMGIELPKSDDIVVSSIVNTLVSTLANTTTNTVEDNMKTLFGELDDSLKFEKTTKEEKKAAKKTEKVTEIETEPEVTPTEPVTDAATEPVVTDPAAPETAATPAETDKVIGGDITPTETEKATEGSTESSAATETDAATDTETDKVTETETETETEKVTETETEKVTETEAKDPEKDPKDENGVNTANGGLLSALSKLDTKDPMASLENEETSKVVTSAFNQLLKNPEMKSIVKDIATYLKDLIKAAKIDINDVQYQPLFEGICDRLSSTLTYCLQNGKNTPEEVLEELEPLLLEVFEEYEVDLPAYQVRLFAQCAMAEFLGSSKYIDQKTQTVTVSPEDVLKFMGLKKSEYPDWIN